MSLNGINVLLKKGTAAAGTVIGGARSTQVSFNSEMVDVTSADNTNLYRELLSAAGIKTASITMSGIVKDNTAHLALLTDFNAGLVEAYGLVLDDLATIDGSWKMTSLEMSAEYNGEVPFSLTLESGGDLTIASVA